MKKRILMVVALSFTMIGFAQKNEIKAAEKALKGGDSAAAKTSLEAVSGMISGADEKIQAQYHFTRGKIYSDLAKKGDNFVDATLENVATGKYPLSRFLYVYVNKHPNKPLSPIDAEFLKMVLSVDGQKIVEKDGYVPLSGKMAMAELKKLGLL